MHPKEVDQTSSLACDESLQGGTWLEDDEGAPRKREPLRSKRYVPPPKPVEEILHQKVSGRPMSPGPSQKTLDRSTGVLALPAFGGSLAPPPQRSRPKRVAPPPAKQSVYIEPPEDELRCAPPGPQVPINQFPAFKNHFPFAPQVHRVFQGASAQTTNSSFPTNKISASVTSEDAKALSIRLWTLEQLLRAPSSDQTAIQSFVQANATLINGVPHLKRLWAIWRITELLRAGRIPATAEDFELLDEILPSDKDRTDSLLLNIKTEAVIKHLRVAEDRSDRNWRLFSWSLRLFFTEGIPSSDLLERRAELLAIEKSRRKQVSAKALLARYPLERVLKELHGVVEEAKSKQPTFLEQVFDDIRFKHYQPLPPAPLLGDHEAAVLAQKDALEANRAANGASFSGREPGLVNLQEVKGKKATKSGKFTPSAKAAQPVEVNGLVEEDGNPLAISRRNLAFKPGKHKIVPGPVQHVVKRPAGTPIRERWWETQLQGPYTHGMKSRLENGDKKRKTLEGGFEERKTSTRERKSVAGGNSDFEWGASEEISDEEEEKENWAVLGDEEEEDGHEGICKVCREPGTLLLCEGCPAVYHFRCAGLSEMPLEDKWWCPECVQKGRGLQENGGGLLQYNGGGSLLGGTLNGQPVGRPRASGEETAAAVLIMLGDGND